MLGRAASLTFPPRGAPPADAPVVLAVRGLGRRGAFADVSCEVRAGEIVGLAGLVGSGRSEVARAIFGADRPDRGTVEIDGVVADIRRPSDAIGLGLAMVPESRKDQGLVMRMSVGHNVTLPHLDRVSTAGVIERVRERAAVGELLRRLAVQPPRPAPLVARLSGGNQQKVLFAKWLFDRPRALILDEPTRGVDVGAKRAIYELIVSLAAEGMAVLLISSEIEEVLGLCHRVLVMRRGRIVAELSGDELREDSVLRAAFGSAPADVEMGAA
jgi:ABC-type sugar transport system ATPase subunit